MRQLTIDEINKPLARPEQLLVEHISNMINQLPNIIEKSKPQFSDLLDEEFPQEDMDFILQLILLTSIISHDFGKLAPAFQIKITGITLPKAERKYSFHIETSAIFARELFLVCLKKSSLPWCIYIHYTYICWILYGRIL